MANQVVNFAKGRAVELHKRVDEGDQFIVVIFTGSDTDANLRQVDSLQEIIDSGLTEVAGQRKVITSATQDYVTYRDSGGANQQPDDAQIRWNLTLPNVTWSALSAGAVTTLYVCYDPTGSGATPGAHDTSIIPVTQHEFNVSTNGSDVTAQFSSAGYYSAT